MVNVGDRIRDRRKELGMTQLELAEKIGYTNRSSIANIETGLTDLPISKFEAIASALEISPGELLGPTTADEEEMLRGIIRNEDIKNLLFAGSKCTHEQIEAVINMIKAMQK